ncbi:MAG: MFS transporter [Saprospiraceae bacterium]
MISLIKNAFSGIPSQVWLLSGISLINRSGAMVICFLTLYLTENLHFTIQEAGFVMSSYGMGAIFGAFLGGKFTDRFGYRLVMLSTLIATGLVLLLAMNIRGFWPMCTTLFILNCISEAFRPASSVSIRMNSNDEIRVRSFSLYRVFINLAVSLALIFGGIIIGFGWKWIFICDALSCFFAAVLLLIYLPPEDKSRSNKVVTGNKEISFNTVAHKDTNFIWFLFFTFLGAVVFMQILWTIPPFFKQIYGWNESKIGLVSAVNGTVVMLVELPLIFLLDGKRKTMWMIRVGILLYGVSYLLLIFPAEYILIWAIAYMVIISFGEIFVMPFSSTWVSFRSPDHNQGRYIAYYTMSYSIANVIAPWLGTQVVAHFGFNLLWFLMALLSIIAFAGFWMVEHRILKESTGY